MAATASLPTAPVAILAASTASVASCVVSTAPPAMIIPFTEFADI